MSLRRIVWAVVMGCCSIAAAAGADTDLTRGSVRLGGEEVSLAPARAIWDAQENRVELAFFARPPGAAAEEAAQQDGVWQVDAAGPMALVELEFTPGSESGMAGELRGCRVSVHGLRRSGEWEGDAAACHLLSVGGILRPGGMLIGLVQGEGAGYALRLPFSVSLAAPGGEVAAAVAAVTPASPLPPGTVRGTATFDGQELSVSHGLAWWDAGRGQLRVALFDREPPPGMLRDLRAGSWGEGGPVAALHLELPAGAPATAASVGYCFLNVSFARGGSIGNNTDAAGCGISELAAEPRPGGHVAARLAGSAPGPGERRYAWNLQFHLAVAP